MTPADILIEEASVEDWTCPNCGHQSPTRTFDILEQMQARMEQMQARMDHMAQHHHNAMNLAMDMFNVQKAKLDRAEKVIDYYANPDNWHDGSQCHNDQIDPEDTEPANGELSRPYTDYVAGKKARQYKRGL